MPWISRLHLLENCVAVYSIITSYCTAGLHLKTKDSVLSLFFLCIGVSVWPQMWGYQVEHGAVFSPTFLSHSPRVYRKLNIFSNEKNILWKHINWKSTRLWKQFTKKFSKANKTQRGIYSVIETYRKMYLKLSNISLLANYFTIFAKIGKRMFVPTLALGSGYTGQRGDDNFSA